ncbi:MAG: hypothetical protein WC045_00535 [Patescibacteria group bacterium]
MPEPKRLQLRADIAEATPDPISTYGRKPSVENQKPGVRPSYLEDFQPHHPEDLDNK